MSYASSEPVDTASTCSMSQQLKQTVIRSVSVGRYTCNSFRAVAYAIALLQLINSIGVLQRMPNELQFIAWS